MMWRQLVPLSVSKWAKPTDLRLRCKTLFRRPQVKLRCPVSEPDSPILEVDLVRHDPDVLASGMLPHGEQALVVAGHAAPQSAGGNARSPAGTLCLKISSSPAGCSNSTLSGTITEEPPMQRAKAFFYVSLGVLALAASFHFGARSARGQAGGPITAASIGDGGEFAAVESSGKIWLLADDGVGVPLGFLMAPKAGAIIAVEYNGWASVPSLDGAPVRVLYEDGDAYSRPADSGSAWIYLGNIFTGAPVQMQGTTWGRLKALHR